MAPTYFLYGIGFLLMLRAFVALTIWRRTMALRIGRSRRTIVDREAAPALLPVFAAAEKALAPLGFQFSHAACVEQRDVAGSPPRTLCVFVHPELHTYATATPAELAEAGAPFDIEFETFLDNGDVVSTLDGRIHLLRRTPAWNRSDDRYLGNLDKQWALHQQRLADLAPEARTVDYSPDQFTVLMNDRVYAEYHAYSVEHGDLVATGVDGVWSFSTRAGARLTRQLLQGKKKLAAMAKARGKMPVDIEAQVAADFDAFERAAQHPTGCSQSWLGKLALFVVSALAFAVVFGLSISWRAVSLLAAILAFHELGHLLGMRLFGYRDSQILFLPFMGAAAIGEKDDATPAQKVIVSLLGPLPGLVLGFAVFASDTLRDNKLVFEAAVMAVTINGLNLLPFLPFDGGRIVETLFFTRMPRIRIAFLMTSFSIAALGAWALSDFALAAVALALALSFQTQCRWTKAVRRVARLVAPDADRAARLRMIFDTLGRAPLNYPATVRMALAKPLLEHVSSPASPWGTMLVGGSVYVGLLVAMIALPVYALIQQPVRGEGSTLNAAIVHTERVTAAEQARPCTASDDGPSRPRLAYVCPDTRAARSRTRTRSYLCARGCTDITYALMNPYRDEAETRGALASK